MMSAKTAFIGIMFSFLPWLCIAEHPVRDYWPTEGWRTSTPEAQGMDSATLQRLDEQIQADLPDLSSCILIRHGYIVLEKYFSGGADELRSTFCITKSIISALLGIAIQQGHVQTLQQKVLDFFPEIDSASLNPFAAMITIRDLLTMTGGMRRLTMSPDVAIIQAAMKDPLARKPGADFFYNDIDPTLLSMILTRSVKCKASDFGAKYLFSPLGIADFTWYEFNEISYGAYGLSLRPRDMAKIGFLYLNAGKWQGNQIIPPAWIAESTRKQVEIPESSEPTNLSYGYLWWICQPKSHPAFYAHGQGGQIILVLPDLDIVWVTTSDSRAYEFTEFLHLAEDYIVPAVRN